MSEEIKETKKKRTSKKAKKEIETNNRFVDVIEKMEEETKKVQKKENIEDKNTAKENKDKQKGTTSKKRNLPKKTQIETQLETIEEQIRKNNTTFKEEISKVYKDIFVNIIYANVILIYFILLIIGYKTIEKNIFLIGIKVLSVVSIMLTIFVYEIAYKKDSGKWAKRGIELMFLSIGTLISLKMYLHYNNKFVSSMTSLALLFSIYYVGNSIIIYMKQKKEAKKYKNDIRKIAKK
ncbi:MAG: hypothetical protein HFJ41_06505 [Clostridia bacterium]|nr:hypothetical protein [Clostridia bacterium]